MPERTKVCCGHPGGARRAQQPQGGPQGPPRCAWGDGGACAWPLRAHGFGSAECDSHECECGSAQDRPAPRQPHGTTTTHWPQAGPLGPPGHGGAGRAAPGQLAWPSAGRASVECHATHTSALAGCCQGRARPRQPAEVGQVNRPSSASAVGAAGGEHMRP